MIFNIPAGRPKVDCKFLGAVGETLTFKQNGNTVYTVTDGATISIKPGVYSVTGSVSGYTKTITVKKAGTYNAYPDGAVFWYGRQIVALGSGVLSNFDRAVVVSDRTTYYNLRFWAAATNNHGFYGTTVPVDMSKYTSCKIRMANTGGGTVYAAVTPGRSIQSTNASVSVTSGSPTTYSLNIASVSSGYPGVGTSEYNVYSRYIDLYAIWME